MSSLIEKAISNHKSGNINTTSSPESNNKVDIIHNIDEIIINQKKLQQNMEFLNSTLCAFYSTQYEYLLCHLRLPSIILFVVTYILRL
jgi:hypothetical protein